MADRPVPPNHYFPPGGRLGIDPAGVLVPGLGQDQRSLISDDGMIWASIVEHPWFRHRDVEQAWTRDPLSWRLDSETEIESGIFKRVWTNLAPASDAPLRELAIAHDEGIERLSLGCARGKRTAKRWHALIDQILASAALRPAVSLDQFFAEHRFRLDAGALHASHFGSRLHLTLAKPAKPEEAWSGPRIVVDALRDLDGDYDRLCGANEVETVSDGTTWFSSAAPLALGDGNFIRNATGIADVRSITLSATFDTSTATIINARMLDVMNSLRFRGDMRGAR